MIKQDLLDYETHLDDKHIADFDDLDMAKSFADASIKAGIADKAYIVNKWTGELVHDVKVAIERKVVPFNYEAVPEDDLWEFG